MNTKTDRLSDIRARAATLGKILLAFGVWGLASASECVQPDASLADYRTVRAVVEGIVAADNVEDFERVLSYYADNAVLISPEGADLVGTDAIRAHYQALFAAVDLTIQSRIDDITIAANLAVVRGLNTVSAANTNTGQINCAASKFLMTLRLIDGAWKISQLIWTNQTIECQ